MMFKRLDEVANLCVLRISTAVLGTEGTVLSDQNAASDYARFLHPRQWPELDLDAIYAMDWRHPGDPIAYWRHKARKCAEVLVPHRVDRRFLTGAYVPHDGSRRRLLDCGFTLPVAAEPVLFFR
jgi:hypothetical protein